MAAVKAIAYSYWRRIAAGARKFASVPTSVRDDVRTLARDDVEAGAITADEYAVLIGEPYPDAAAAQTEV